MAPLPAEMDRRVERAAALAVVGIGLAAFQQFGPLLWPYGLGPSWSVATAVLYFLVDLVWVAAMVATYLRDPDGRMWQLFLLYRVVTTLGVLWAFPTSLTWTLSQFITGLGSVVFVHLVLAFPTGRLTDPYDRRIVGVAYGLLAVSRVAWVLVWQPASGQVGFAPRNPFVVAPNDTLAFLFGPVALVGLAFLLLAGVVVGLGRHWQRASPVLRRSLLPITIAAPIQLGFTVAWYLGGAIPSEWGTLRGVLQSPIVALAGLVFPVGYLVGLVRARLARAAVADLAVELGRGVPLGGLRDALARAVGDSTLVLAFPAPAGDGFVGADGAPIELPDASDDSRAVARLERDGELLAALAYDPAIEREDPGRVAAVTSVARLALENERLAAQVRAQLEEVRASRSRIVDAADAERRRIERDLHDGAQQRLVALAMRLDQARAQSAGASDLIDATTAELLAAIREVRDLARGVHPPILTDAGLAAAIEALAERTPFPVTIEATDERFAPEVEAAAYFVVAEGLTNIARYANASGARVNVVSVDGRLHVRVSDDGKGGADPAAGSGLRGLEDRLAAVGGELRVTSEPGAGTTLLATLPAGT
jgi:signal transduction histidine kinase